MAQKTIAVARAALATLVIFSLVLSSAGCLVEEEKPAPAEPKVPDDRKDARLIVDGSVGTPLNWTVEQLIDLGAEDFTATFVNSVGTTKTSNFTGVRVLTILGNAHLNPSAEILEVEAADGYRATIFLSDVTATTYLAFKEEGEWQNLSDAGALRLVDTHMGSVYWVKQVVALHLMQSALLKLSGHIYYMGPFTNQSISAAYLHAHATTNVTWKEGTKTRTGKGMTMAELNGRFNITEWMLELLVPGKDRVVRNASTGTDSIAIDSKGRFVFVSGETPLAVGLAELRAVNGIHIHGDVMKEVNATSTDLSALPQVPVFYTYAGTGPSLESVLGLAGIRTGATTVLLGPGDDTVIVIPIGELANYTVIEREHPTMDTLHPYIELILLAPESYSLPNWCPVKWIDVRTT